jgi:hypothetical protein
MRSAMTSRRSVFRATISVYSSGPQVRGGSCPNPNITADTTPTITSDCKGFQELVLMLAVEFPSPLTEANLA